MIFNQSKYTIWYYNIISRAKSRILSKKVYTENHHIIPRSLGGNDDKNNLAKLTGREHFICHILLTKMTSGKDRSKMVRAVIMMKSHNKKQIRYFNSRLYETCRKEYSKQQSVSMTGGNNNFYGKKHSKITCDHLSKIKKGKNCSWNTGLTKETSIELQTVSDRIAKSKKGVRWWTNGILETQSRLPPEKDWIIGRLSNASYKWDQSRKDAKSIEYKGGKMNWWNDGVKNKRDYDPPGPEWKRGRLMSSSLYDKFCKNKK
jgi:hypothetical protein